VPCQRRFTTETTERYLKRRSVTSVVNVAVARHLNFSLAQCPLDECPRGPDRGVLFTLIKGVLPGPPPIQSLLACRARPATAVQSVIESGSDGDSTKQSVAVN
jgi:hypothetical protein